MQVKNNIYKEDNVSKNITIKIKISYLIRSIKGK